MSQSDRKSAMRHILAASQPERNALVRASGSDRRSRIRSVAQQRRLLISQPASHQRPYFSLGRLADQHFNVPEIVGKALLASKIDELLVLGTDLVEQLAASPGRVLMVTGRAQRQRRHLNLGQTGPPILVGIAKTPEQAVPTHAFQGQANGFVLRAALEP